MRHSRGLAGLVAAAYAWILAVFLGAVLLDIIYSSLLQEVDAFEAGPSVFSEVSDFLLMLGALTIAAALAAVVVSWAVRSARRMFLASVVLLVGFEFLAPVVLFPVLRGSQGSSVLGLGPLVRLVPTGVASLLAFTGFLELSRRRDHAAPA